ncbi:MAG: hypothetical protein E7A50_08010, partial [Clostridiales bacterium]|nr:hypothetical protein [Clostridiales bacterium]
KRISSVILAMRDTPFDTLFLVETYCIRVSLFFSVSVTYVLSYYIVPHPAREMVDHISFTHKTAVHSSLCVGTA